MMAYYFNDIIDEKGYHDIHTRDCPYLSNRNIEIGIYDNARDAMKAAHEGLPRKLFNGCQRCCSECYKDFGKL